ncbi:hypothetical protein [Phenylobacterium sp.]|jgi:hypothetical protein|uniref:hypothetical protein n=1 Tax=Phenylobacterium sp. TaxID=1871053 RepID=UPI002F92144F
MRNFMRTALLAGSAFALTAGAAAAQGWMPMEQRHQRLEQRIETGVQSGQLTRREAVRLRTEFDALLRLEDRYMANGLSNWERSDLDQRYDALSAQIRVSRRDDDRRDYARNDDWGRWYGGANWRDERGQWVSLDRRRAQLERRINQGLRNGQLTASEAARLRADFNGLMRVEARYRRNGFTPAEMADLDRRFDTLAQMIRFERNDRDRTYGYNNYRR